MSTFISGNICSRAINTINNVSWINLSKARNSLFSRALLSISIAALVLAKLPNLSFLGGIFWSMRILLFGSIIFLFGYLLFGKFSPPEFKPAGAIWEIVNRMMGLADRGFFIDRLQLSERLLHRSKARQFLPPPEAAIKMLEANIREARNVEPNVSWEQAARALFHADLNLRQYDKPCSRLVTGIFLGSGVLLIALPAILNIISVLSDASHR